jgi:tRNA (guanine37-N1)-methyltransferase
VRIDVFTLFPEWFGWMRSSRPFVNATREGGLDVRAYSFRPTTPLGQGQVDDSPYGGGPGMVVRVDVVAAALASVYRVDPETVRDSRRVVVLTPRGRRFSDALAREYATGRDMVLLCGRYEGFDERVHTCLAGEELSLGDFVLAGGEVAAMAVIEAVARRVPGALGNVESLEAESFSPALRGGVEHPHYTRPAVWRGHAVPPTLLSGDHAAIARWRAERVRPRRGA